MKNSPRKTKQPPQFLSLWNLAQAQRAVPYLTSILRSLREHWLERQTETSTLERLARLPGRLNRTQLVAQLEAQRSLERASAAYEEAAAELYHLGVHLDSAGQGQALLPIMQDRLLAWLVFDLFAEQPLRCWRFSGDPTTVERPLSELQDTKDSRRLFC